MTSTTTPSTYTNPEPTTTSLLTPASRRTALTSETPLKSALRGSTTPVGTVGSPPGSTHTGYIRPEPAAHFSEPSAPTQGTMSAFTGAASMTDGLPDLPDDFPLFEYPGNSTDAITMPTTAPTTAPTPTESTMSPPAHWGLPLPYHPYRAPSFADPGFTQPTPDDTRAELYTNLYNTHALISDVLAERPHARAPLDAAFFTAYETLNHTADTNLTMAALRDYTSKSSRTLSAYSQQVCETKNHSRVEDFMTGNAASCVATFDTLLNQISNGLGWMQYVLGSRCGAADAPALACCTTHNRVFKESSSKLKRSRNTHQTSPPSSTRCPMTPPSKTCRCSKPLGTPTTARTSLPTRQVIKQCRACRQRRIKSTSG